MPGMSIDLAPFGGDCFSSNIRTGRADGRMKVMEEEEDEDEMVSFATEP